MNSLCSIVYNDYLVNEKRGIYYSRHSKECLDSLSPSFFTILVKKGSEDKIQHNKSLFFSPPNIKGSHHLPLWPSGVVEIYKKHLCGLQSNRIYISPLRCPISTWDTHKLWQHHQRGQVLYLPQRGLCPSVEYLCIWLWGGKSICLKNGCRMGGEKLMKFLKCFSNFSSSNLCWTLLEKSISGIVFILWGDSFLRNDDCYLYRP